MSERACQVPLLELLDSVPRECHQMIEIASCHHRNIPYGRLCHEAADRIRELEKALSESNTPPGQETRPTSPKP